MASAPESWTLSRGFSHSGSGSTPSPDFVFYVFSASIHLAKHYYARMRKTVPE